MTLKEAYDNYEIQVEQKIEAHKKKYKKNLRLCAIVAPIVTFIVVISDLLLLIDYNFFLVMIIANIALFCPLCLSWSKLFEAIEKLKKGPSFFYENKELYFNCLTASDINEEGRFYYREKLEEMRHCEKLEAIARVEQEVSIASTTASAAMMYSVINKK